MVPTLEKALENAELEAIRTKTCNLDQVLVLSATDCHHPTVAAAWRDTLQVSGEADILFPSRRVASLVVENSVDPQAVGHALVLASCGGFINCVRRLRDIMSANHSHGMLVPLFNAYAFLKACENGHQDVVRELLRPKTSASTAIMGYIIVTRWKEKDSSSYPFVKQTPNIPNKEWVTKLISSKNMLPAAAPILRAGGWDLKGMPGVPEELHDCIRASYSLFLLWRAGVVAATSCHVEVFKVLLRQRALENTMLADSFHDTSVPKKSFDHDGRRIISERARMDTLMYQLVEELSTKNYNDGILYALWAHIQRGGRDSPRPEVSRPRCVAQAANGVWEMQLEVPQLMMPVEHALQEEEPLRRYKQLTQLFSQRAKVNIQLTSTIESLPNCLQVVVGIKHVRFKVENARFDNECMGHFPSMITLSVTPMTNEGTGVTMTHSSSNIIVKIGKMERIQLGSNAGDGANRGLSGGIGAAASVGVTSTMKNKPWRFEQLPLKDERGGSFVWTLQSMKGVLFDRSNPMRMAERNSKWRFGRRMPSNPLDELPFTSEGGVIFTSAEFDDTMMWRFPKHMEGCKMRWSIEGQIHSTFTTTRYFETRMATFCGDIEEPLKPLEVKDKNGIPKNKIGEKGEKPPKADKGEEKPPKNDKQDKGDHKSKQDKDNSKESSPETLPTINPTLYTTDAEYLEFLEFKRFREGMRNKTVNAKWTDELGKSKEIVGFVVPELDQFGNQDAIEI